MENKLWADIQAQGSNLSEVVRHLYTAGRARVEAAAAFLRGDKPVALIGVASAEYLCQPAQLYLGQNGRPALVLNAAEALYSYLPTLKNASVVINSRSGETAEIVKLGQALVEQGTPFVAVTNEPESTLAKMASHIVWAQTRKDELVSINVVTGMMTATLVLAAAVLGQVDAMRPDFERLAEAMEPVVAQAARQARAMLVLMLGMRPVYLLYRGSSSAAAYNGRLVFEEIARTPAVAMGAAEFRQGPNEVIDERFGAVVFAGEGKQGELNLSLARDILRSGGRVLLVNSQPGAPEAHPRQLVFPIPAVPEALRPVLEVVPVQVLAYQLAEAQGYAPGEVRYISKVILTEEGIPNQVQTGKSG